MKTKRFIAAMFTVLTLFPATVAHATKFWKNSVVTGNWSTGNNWSASSQAGADNGGVPVASEHVVITHSDGTARTVTLDVSTPTLGTLYLDLTGAGAAADTLVLSGNSNLSAAAIGVGGNNGFALTNGRGAINQSAGTITVGSTPGNDLKLGWGSGSSGTYTLSGGNLVANQGEFIGMDGMGTFNHSAGTNTISSGALFAIGINNGSSGTYNLSGSGLLVTNIGEHVGYLGGTGFFNQTGGSHTVNSALFVGEGLSGTYTLSGGSLSVSGIVRVGFSIGSNGNFNQSGGTSVLGSELRLAEINGTGTFTLSGGTANVNGSTFVGGGSSAGGTGVATISGTGVLTVAGTLVTYNTPGTSLNLSGGTINTTGLNFNGVPALFNWTSGKLNLTANVTWDSAAAATSTAAAFGSARTLGNNQTLMVTGNEALGGAGAFGLTLNSGSSHHVTGTLTLSAMGTITQNAGSTLYAATFTQAGGTVNGMLQNQGNFIYQSGQFNGRLLNQGTVSLGPSFAAGNGVENDATMTLAAGQTLTVNGAGLDNLGTLTLAGGTVSGSGPVVNNYGGTLTAYGTINPSLTNNGVLEVDGVLRLGGGTNTNSGIVRGSGTVIGAFINSAGGTVDLASGNSLAMTSDWSNSGLVSLEDSAVLGGGAITNSGTIQGAGTVNASIANAGVIRASGGELDLVAAGNTNPAAGLIQASTDNTVMFLQGLATNTGTIGLTGGAFDNNNHALSNTGIINGYGVIRTSGLTNTSQLNVGEGNMDVFGSVTNSGTVGIQGGRSIYFFGPVSGPGSYTGTGTAVFLAAVSPGSSPAAVSFGGNATLAATSTLNIEVGGTTAGQEYDQLLVSGALTLGGALDVTLINGFTPSAGQSFDILDWGSLAGAFSPISLPTLAGLIWDTSRLYTTGILSVAAPGLPGDYNNNGIVDVADYVAWRKGLVTPSPENYNLWRANFGQTSGGGSGATGSASAPAVPEPESILGLLLVATLLLTSRSRVAPIFGGLSAAFIVKFLPANVGATES